ncbi:DUF3179 domain-containing protein [Amylibacter sp.]|nr:DUF3179 domain-containing protein [Amylibacter sp.]
MRHFLIFLLSFITFSTVASAQTEFWKHEWPNTDFGKSDVPFIEILSGGPPRDGIPAIDNPQMIRVDQSKNIPNREPVMVVELDGETARAYPIRYLMWHEIANDTVGGTPIAVTFCPLCNSGIIFDRRVSGKTLTFGVSGKLRNSDMIMFDRETESWWQQYSGTGIVGAQTGRKLKKLPGWMESWGAFKARNPDGLVMAEPKSSRRYGQNPYAGYDSLDRPFLYNGEMPPHGIEPLSRVVVVKKRAWPLERLRKLNEITEKGVTISWIAGTASALDAAKIGQGKDVGSIRVKNAKGQDIAHDVAFAFAFHAFHPNGKWMLGN